MTAEFPYVVASFIRHLNLAKDVSAVPLSDHLQCGTVEQQRTGLLIFGVRFLVQKTSSTMGEGRESLPCVLGPKFRRS